MTSTDEFVYFAKAQTPPFSRGHHEEIIKIGRSCEPDKRIQAVNNQNKAWDIEEEHRLKTNDSRLLEKVIHKIEDEYRVEGEWFRLPITELNDWKNYNRLDRSVTETLQKRLKQPNNC